MHLKFLKHGTGSGRKTVAYLLSEVDHLGTEREAVEVLRGDPQQVAEVCESLDFRHRYSSGVISWAPEDEPTSEEISGVLDDLERAMTVGLDDPSRIAWSAVLHREQGGGAHVHFLVARVDLETGKSYNVAPPGWEKLYYPLRDAWNWERGWARPDDPLRSRLYQPDRQALIEASQLRAGLEVEADPKALITRYLVQRIEDGSIQDRAGIVKALREAGLTVPRHGKDYLTVLDPESQQRYRLKGALYAADFTPEAWRELGRSTSAEDRSRRRTPGPQDRRAAEQARGRFERALATVGDYRRGRYPGQPEPDREALRESLDYQFGHEHRVDPWSPDWPGAVRLLEAPRSKPSRHEAARDRGEPETATPGVFRNAGEPEAALVPDREEHWDTGKRSKIAQQTRPIRTDRPLGEKDDDRARDSLRASLGRLDAAIGRNDKAVSGLVADTRRLERAARERHAAFDRLGKYLEPVREHIAAVARTVVKRVEAVQEQLRAAWEMGMDRGR